MIGAFQESVNDLPVQEESRSGSDNENEIDVKQVKIEMEKSSPSDINE